MSETTGSLILMVLIVVPVIFLGGDRNLVPLQYINLEITKKTIFLKIWTTSLLCKRFNKRKLDYK